MEKESFFLTSGVIAGNTKYICHSKKELLKLLEYFEDKGFLWATGQSATEFIPKIPNSYIAIIVMENMRITFCDLASCFSDSCNADISSEQTNCYRNIKTFEANQLVFTRKYCIDDLDKKELIKQSEDKLWLQTALQATNKSIKYWIDKGLGRIEKGYAPESNISRGAYCEKFLKVDELDCCKECPLNLISHRCNTYYSAYMPFFRAIYSAGNLIRGEEDKKYLLNCASEMIDILIDIRRVLRECL